MDDLGTLLKEKRNELKLSLRDAASLIGISHSYLSMLEKGIDPRNNSVIKPTPETLNLISNAYNIDYNKLMKLVGYINLNTDEQTNLTEKDKKDIQKDLKEIMDEYREQKDGSKYYNGVELQDEDFDYLELAMQVALEKIKVKNKEKYTPIKFKK
ncbi:MULTISPECIES: helix-turn-helix transcriptional regulator [unclassified Clostridium]|uniref:helix-turn-helix domain-containing protein n=1 Tax=unclassified Clostridium TaxID=2614128 RepID=UPI0002980F7D|nr:MULTISPECIES: helix-turn-helix transcriptional regulator [unclassified Clostridium]EKQ52406.1 MAG: Helix-turn-helix protein [Clostridium sp. Maddingley MBC34-26]